VLLEEDENLWEVLVFEVPVSLVSDSSTILDDEGIELLGAVVEAIIDNTGGRV